LVACRLKKKDKKRAFNRGLAAAGIGRFFEQARRAEQIGPGFRMIRG